jgi:MFS family permease
MLDSSVVDKLSIFATLALIPLTVFAGWLSDIYGRKPVVLSGIMLGAILIYPSFEIMRYLGIHYAQNQMVFTLPCIGAILIMLSSILALVVGPQTALLAELFSAKSRNSAATLPHNLAAGWVGGLLPLIVTWLNQQWENNIAGLFYPSIFLICAAIIAYKYLPETSQTNLHH